MKVYTIVNCYSGEIIEVTAIYYEIDKFQHNFYKDENGNILESSYNTRNWDIRKVKNNGRN